MDIIKNLDEVKHSGTYNVTKEAIKMFQGEFTHTNIYFLNDKISYCSKCGKETNIQIAEFFTKDNILAKKYIREYSTCEHRKHGLWKQLIDESI